MDNAKVYPFYYPLRPATLKEFALTRLALDLWRRKGFNIANSIVTYPEEEFSCEELQITLPSIREIIDKRIRSIRKELEILFDNFNKLSIMTNLNENAVECLNCITYGPDGTLSIEATVKNMLASDNLSVFEKYMIACVYRFDQDIRKFWPEVFKNMRNSEECQKMCYSSTNPVIENTTATIRLSRMELHFYRLMDCGNWTGLEYFLNCINDTEEQCRVLSRALHVHGFKSIKYVLPKLNQAQAEHILQTYPDFIIRSLASEEGYFEYVLKVWFLVKESMTELNFLFLLIKLVSIIYLRTNRWNCDQVSQITMVLREIWANTPARLKNFFFDHISLLFTLLGTPMRDTTIKTEDFDLDVEFISQLLADMTIELRTTVWIEYWDIFLINFDSEYFNRFMRFCLKNDDIEEFIQNNMLNYEISKNLVKYLSEKQLYGSIMKYIDFCSAFCNDYLVQEFKKQIELHFPSFLRYSKFENLLK